ncbi:hypothetical protein H2248_005360 [Termitomyces sp. 'cryptogamus']|nr:hypothetical protein H2248_005360 [Termitomyces sp. 'cryptogamus']
MAAKGISLSARGEACLLLLLASNVFVRMLKIPEVLTKPVDASVLQLNLHVFQHVFQQARALQGRDSQGTKSMAGNRPTSTTKKHIEKDSDVEILSVPMSPANWELEKRTTNIPEKIVIDINKDSDIKHSDIEHSDIKHSDIEHSDIKHSDVEDSDIEMLLVKGLFLEIIYYMRAGRTW